MRANRCHTFCVQKDFSTNEEIFKPRKDCTKCEYFKKLLKDDSLKKLAKDRYSKAWDEIIRI